MLNSGKKIALGATKKNILTLVLSEKKILNETKNHNPPCKLNGWSLINLWNSFSFEVFVSIISVYNPYRRFASSCRWARRISFGSNTTCISITEPSRWTSTLRDSSGTSNGSLVDFWGKLKNRSLYFYDLIRSKMSRNCILSVTKLNYYYICHFYKIYHICSYAEAAFIKTIAVFTASTYWKDVFIT